MLRADISLLLNTLPKEFILDVKGFRLGFSHICQKVHTKYFSYLIAKGTDLNIGIGVITGKKKVNRAVQRNACRRLNKEMFRQHKHLFEHTILIVLTNNNAACATKEELWHSINEFLTKYV